MLLVCNIIRGVAFMQSRVLKLGALYVNRCMLGRWGWEASVNKQSLRRKHHSGSWKPVIPLLRPASNNDQCMQEGQAVHVKHPFPHSELKKLKREVANEQAALEKARKTGMAAEEAKMKLQKQLAEVKVKGCSLCLISCGQPVPRTWLPEQAQQ